MTMRIRMITARKTVLRRALALLICLGILRSSHGQAFTIPGLSDLPALPGLATGLVNSITSGAMPRTIGAHQTVSGTPDKLGPKQFRADRSITYDILCSTIESAIAFAIDSVIVVY